MHPYFSYSFKEKFTQTEFDLVSGWKAKDTTTLKRVSTN